jgi:hypothetical protein
MVTLLKTKPQRIDCNAAASESSDGRHHHRADHEGDKLHGQSERHRALLEAAGAREEQQAGTAC